MQRVVRVFFFLCAVAAVFANVAAQTTISTRNQNQFQTFLANLRSDLEMLADFTFGGGARPDAWTGNADVNTPTIIADLWFDNEQLADQIFGQGMRPPDWIGATTPNAALVVRNIRHDLELSAETQIGTGLRPPNWVGANKLYSCERTVLNLVYLLETVYNITPTTPESVRDYCATLAGELENELVRVAFSTAVDQSALPALVLAVRGDLERLRDEKLGLNVLPEGWLNNKDINSPTLANDIFSDLALLADTLLGTDRRPPGWLGAFSASAPIAYRNLRYDLELLTDFTLGEGVRPRGWQGVDPLSQCPPMTQNLVLLVQRNFVFDMPDASGSSNSEAFCAQVRLAANLAAENPKRLEEAGTGEETEEEKDTRYMAESQIAFSYLDPAATKFMGEMPKGTKFRAWYRNFGGSNMMFVSGENFALFIDRRWTTMSEEVFRTLPTLEGVRPLAFCDASWCNGPRATPTPTGGGPIFDLIYGVTPPPTIPAGSSSDPSGRRLVSWNHIRVTYVQQSVGNNRAQVALEICEETTQVVCEPVVSVLNTVTGVPIPIVSTFNGLNVFELAYGYSANVLITGRTLVSQDIWLNDPSLSGQ